MQVAYAVQDAGPFGKGLFALEDIPKGTLLWKFEEGKSVRLWTKDTILQRLEGLSKEEATFVLVHMYPEDGCVATTASVPTFGNGGAWPGCAA
jgi:hypothetical protein